MPANAYHLEDASGFTQPLKVAVCEECGWESNPTPDPDDATRHAEEHVRAEHGTPFIEDAEPTITVDGVDLVLTPCQQDALARAREVG